MARLPTIDDLSGPASLRSGRAIASADVSAIGRGLQSFGNSVSQVGEERVQQENAVDLARAEAFKTEQLMAAENEFAYDPDYTTVGTRASERTGQIVGDAAGLIRDPVMRERWSIGAGTDAANVNDAISDRGIVLQRQAETVAFDEALEASRRIFVDPATPDAIRAKARADIEGAIQMGQASGLLTPGDAAGRTDTYLKDADYSLGLLLADQGGFDGAVPSGDAPALLRTFEGFSSTPYWDVNAHRVGYGSDTVTRADGSVVKVTPGMTVTREDAERDLTRRAAEFEGVALRQVGPDAWNALPPEARAALTSTTYNYGSLPSTVVAAVKTGDLAAVSQAVLDLSSHNGGVNANRRAKEAAIIAGQGNPEWYQRLSPEQQQVINERTTVRQRAVATAETAQRTVAYEQHKESLGLGILTGDVVSEQEILGDPLLQDGDKATLLRSLRTEQDASAGARDFLVGLGDGSAAPLNPYSSDDQALADKSFEMLMGAVTPEQQGPATVQFVTSSGMVPKAVVSTVRQSLNSADPATVAAGLQQSAALYDAAPMAVGNVTNGQEIKDAAATYAELVGEQGLSVDQAAQRVIDMRNPENVVKAEVLDTIWDQAVKDDAFPVGDVVAAFDTSILPGGPAAGLTPYQEEALTSDYLMAAERALKGAANGDVGVARQMALQEMKRTYGVSRVSGQEVVTKFPPENFYPPINGSQEYIRDMAMADALSIVRGSPAPAGIPEGLLAAGNIDLAGRPVTANADGSISTVRSMSFEEEGQEVLVPTVAPDGRLLSDQEAIDLYHQTGEHLGKFATPKQATSYAESLHSAQEQYYGNAAGVSNVMLIPTSETAEDIRAGAAPRYNLLYQRPDGVWDMAPSLFMVDPTSLSDLSAIETGRRQIQLEIERLRASQLITSPRVIPDRAAADAVASQIMALEQQLSGVDAQRAEAVGQAAPATAPVVDDDAAAVEAERLWQEQNAASFGMMGGTQ